MPSTIEVVRERIANATSYMDIFGALPAGDTKGKERALKRQYAYLVRSTHPDHVPPEERRLANDVFPELRACYERAKEAVKAGTYEKAAPETGPAGNGSGGSSITLSSESGTYTVSTEAWMEGDFSNIHLGTAGDGSPVLAKVALDPSMNQYLAHEASILKNASADANAVSIRRFMPELLDSLILTEAGNEQYRVNVYRHLPGYVSLKTVRNAYPDGLDPRDAAWIFRRVLGQTLAASMLSMVHGAIVPEHVLVHPTTHEPLHIGWAHAVVRPKERHARLTTVIDRYRAWYPPEVFAREVPSHQTDLFMAGKMMVYLLGGDVARNRFPRHLPSRIRSIVMRCLREEPARRPEDGLALMRAFTDAVRAEWGRRYRPLSLPNQ